MVLIPNAARRSGSTAETSARGAVRWHITEPSPGRYPCARKSENPVGERIAMAEIVEEPSVERGVAERAGDFLDPSHCRKRPPPLSGLGAHSARRGGLETLAPYVDPHRVDTHHRIVLDTERHRAVLRILVAQ